MIIRAAAPQDAAHFVRVFELASYGLAPYFWRQKAGADGDIHAVAMDSMRSKLADPGLSMLVAEVDGQVAGGVISYDVGPDPTPLDGDFDPVVVPLIELENHALNTHYVNAIAVFPEFRGHGVGSGLLRHLIERHRAQDMAMIVEDQNTGARALYERLGFAEVAEVAVVKGGWETDAEAMFLLKRPGE